VNGWERLNQPLWEMEAEPAAFCITRRINVPFFPIMPQTRNGS